MRESWQTGRNPGHRMRGISPGLAIDFGAIACNLVGNGLRDALNPKLG